MRDTRRIQKEFSKGLTLVRPVLVLVLVLAGLQFSDLANQQRQQSSRPFRILSGNAKEREPKNLAKSEQAQRDLVPQSLKLNDLEYFERPGLDVMVFQDFYPEGHQGGVSIIQNGTRVASNGDIRLESTPGQWQPVPKLDKRIVDRQGNDISAWLSYPDPSKNRKGFNPIDYPELNLSYRIHVRPEGAGFRILVDLDQPLPAAWIGKVGFNLELYPALLFGKAWYLDKGSGIFPRQPGGPMERDTNHELQPVSFANGKRLTIAPESDAQRLIVESRTGDLQLLDGRNKHNNGWFIVRSLALGNVTKGAIDWLVLPSAIPDWKYKPVVHVSQIGYHPKQSKVAVVEIDKSDNEVTTIHLNRISETGAPEQVLSETPTAWGTFLRYKYFHFDFSRITRPGIYTIKYGDFRTEPFRIATDVYQDRVWQPTLEYFLPVQMCHMRVREQYKVWHGACHLDDARMAPIDHNHFDGYFQGPSTLTKFRSGETVPGLNSGGWHDAGDDDLRIESQADEVYILASAYETFGVNYDETTISQSKRDVQIHQPDGQPDLLQQVEHGVLTILGSYRTLGRFYRGMIVPTLSQYVLVGDWANSTDNLFYDPSLKENQRTGTASAMTDDRWVFTERNPEHEYKGVAALAIAGRVLKNYNPQLAGECVAAAEDIWGQERDSEKGFDARVVAAAELFLTTRNSKYEKSLLDNRGSIIRRISAVGWCLGRVRPFLKDQSFIAEIRTAVAGYEAQVERQQRENPFGVPYKPVIWGAGWEIQRFGVEQYFLHRGFPDVVKPEYMLNALNFVLGCHPGENTASFASGVGARSMTIAYGINRADWSYIPGGVVSGTALIRPDLPELKNFPFLWQQGEYVMGGGASNYMFLVLAADHTLNQ